MPVSEKSNPLTRDLDRAPASAIVRMLQACDGQMFEEGAGVRYQVSTPERKNRFTAFGILYSSVILETLQQRGGRNYGGGRQEGGANSQGMLAPPLFLLEPSLLMF